MRKRTISTILPQRLAFNMHRVVIYCRTSTHTQEQLSSMTNQVSKLTQMVARNPQWTLYDIYLDFRSGSTIIGRDEFQRMLEDGINEKYDIVFCKSISRFGRNITDTLHAIRELHKHGVHVIFEQESLDSSNADHTLLISIISAIAEEENENRRKNVNWGMEHRLENGTSRLYTRPCYGYTRDTCGELVINEQQADVVKMVYTLYLKGYSILGIIAVLQQKGIPTPKGKEKWSKRAIEVMLANKKYVGDSIIFKRYIDTMTPVASERCTAYIATGSHPKIITREQFDQVQEERKRRSNIVVDETGAHRKSKKYSAKHVLKENEEGHDEPILSQS